MRVDMLERLLNSRHRLTHDHRAARREDSHQRFALFRLVRETRTQLGLVEELVRVRFSQTNLNQYNIINKNNKKKP